jgi:pilus assembly protein Flp/PilA
VVQWSFSVAGAIEPLGSPERPNCPPCGRCGSGVYGPFQFSSRLLFHFSSFSFQGDVVMSNLLKSFCKGEEGATMVEYGLMVALIAAVCVTTVTTLGKNISGLFTTISAAI